MSYDITLLPGDGIGPEVTEATVQILEKTGVSINWDHQDLGLGAFEKHGVSIPKQTLDSVRQNGLALKGPTTTPVGKGHRSSNVKLRLEFDLFASVRPVKSTPGIKTRYDDVDLVIFRENTEGLYSGQELELNKETVISLKVASRTACTRIAKEAFEYAERHGRKLITLAHKANILKKGDGLFLDCAEQVAGKYPETLYKDVIIDALCMQLVSDPTRFDIILAENLYGDILSDLCAGLVGGLGLVPGANLGKNVAIFEAVHGSAPDIAGKGIANPTALLRSAVLMLEYVGEKIAADRISRAIDSVYANTAIRTGDLGGSASTKDFVKAVSEAL